MSQMFDLNVKNTNWNENSCSYLCKMINNSVLKSCFQYYLLLLNIIEDWVMGQITTYILKNIIRLNTTIKKKNLPNCIKGPIIATPQGGGLDRSFGFRFLHGIGEQLGGTRWYNLWYKHKLISVSLTLC